MTTPRKKKYVPHLASLLGMCEHNYGKLIRLLPEVDEVDLSYDFCVGELLSYQLQITESARYTTTLTMQQLSEQLPGYLKPVMTIRMYHDARSAEVLSCQNIGQIKASYEYPNLHMHQRNEKFMGNVFLAEWLTFCLHWQENTLIK